MAAAVHPHTHDVVIVGGGHNALVAAAYLARAGLSVVVLERLDHLGGAAVSERPWAGVDARLSRYSYLVSLLPRRIIDDLGLRIDLRRRRYSSYTPDPADASRGILIDTADAAATAASFARTTGDPREAARFARVLRAPRARRAHPVPDRHRSAPSTAMRCGSASAMTNCGATCSSNRSAGLLRAVARHRHRPGHRTHRRADRHVLIGRRPEPAARIGASSITSSAAAPGTGTCRSAAWAASARSSSARRATRGPSCARAPP